MTPEQRKTLIKSKGLTQAQLARKINYSRPMLCAALTRGPRETWYRIQRAIADVVGVDYDEFWSPEP